MTETTTASIGFVGLGTMGAAMAQHLVAVFPDVIVWNRTPGRDKALVSAGARRGATPAAVGAEVTIVVLCVTDAPQVEEVLFGANGLVEGLRPGSLVIDCSTISPLRAQEMAARLRDQRVSFVDAPVSGGSEGAQKGTLTIMVGGDDADVARAQPVLAAMGTTITHLGPVGAGQWTKAINQVILAGTYIGVAEGMTLGLKAGLDMEKVVGALVGGAAGSWVLANRSGRMIDNDYPLGFKIELHRKDLAIALDLAETTGTDLAVASLAATYEDALIAHGHGGDDNSALARIVRERSNLPH
jgi:3-hydroxyisobutyrate dehydrogenase